MYLYYGYVKELYAKLPTSVSSIIAKPVGNPKLQAFAFVEKTMESEYPVAVVGKKAYSIISETQHVLLLDLSGTDNYIGEVIIGSGVHILVYYEKVEKDTTVIARVVSSSPFPFTTIDYADALKEARLLREDENFTFERSAEELAYEQRVRLERQMAILSKTAILQAAMTNIIAQLSGYSMDTSIIDPIVNDDNIDADNSHAYLIQEVSGNKMIVPIGNGTSFTFQSVTIPVSMNKVFVLGTALSGGHSVQVSRDNGSIWQNVTFPVGSFISNELVFTGTNTSQVKVRITLQKGNYDYNPMLHAWGLLYQ